MKYLVIETSEGNEPCACGALILGEYESLEEAKRCLHDEADSWNALNFLYCGKDEWKPGYQSNVSIGESSEYWNANDLTAWRGMMENEGWIRLEIFKRDDESGWHQMY